MDTLTRITRSKVQMIQRHPFYATVMLYLDFKIEEGAGTAYTDGHCVAFDPAFVDKLSDTQLLGLIAHEVMHVVNLHHARMNSRNSQLWNEACDYAINPMLLLDGFELPEGGLVNSDYTNLTADEIYDRLQKKQQQQQEKQGKNGGQSEEKKQPKFGDVKPQPSENSRIQEEARVKQIVQQAANTANAKMKGNLSAHIQRMVSDILTPAVDWRAELSAFMTENSRADYNFSHPSSRYLSQGLYLPSLRSIDKAEFVLIVDTSGSIDEELLNKFAAEMQAIASECIKSMTVLYVDTKVCGIQEFEADDQLTLQPQGGGGTDFRPGFDYMQKNNIEPAAIIYFTDGICNSFPSESPYPVLWAQYGHYEFNPPFGTVLKIN